MPNTTYAPQIVRYASTKKAAAAAVSAFTVVELDASGNVVTSNGGAALGVVQYDIPAAASDPQANRYVAVAESGDLIVNVKDSTEYAALAIGDALKVDANGTVDDTAGVAVTVNGSTPICIAKVAQGGVYQAIFKFL
ncbi:MAG: hypothetical protein R3321_00160 [Nitrososphaeraceae archaeon]|nr:hypothetical protein [Nitrososphaeraceae archaeon]